MLHRLSLATFVVFSCLSPAIASPLAPYQVAQEVSFNVREAYDTFLSDLKEAETAIQSGKSPADVERSVRWAEASYRQKLDQLQQHPDYTALVNRFAPIWVRMVGYYGAEALKAAETGYKENSPGYFLGHSGVRYSLGFAQDVLGAYTSFKGENDPDGQRQRKLLADYRAKIQQIGNKYWERLAANEKTPPDAYGGGDKAQLKTAASQAWKALYPKDQILAVRIPMTAWERKARTEFNGATATWQHYDTSYLQARLVIKESAKFHRIQTVHLYKNHQTGALTVSPDKKEHESFPNRLLTQNYKP